MQDQIRVVCTINQKSTHIRVEIRPSSHKQWTVMASLSADSDVADLDLNTVAWSVAEAVRLRLGALQPELQFP